MVSLTEAGTGTGTETKAATTDGFEYEPRSESEEAEIANNPWSVRGLIRYEEQDLVYADRLVVEAAQMTDPEEQRRHLQEVIEFFAAKYFVKFTVEDLLHDADLDIVYVHKMLVESVDEDSDEDAIDYRIVMAKYWEKYGYDDV